jgi:putative nucleotidyltransferase with HDIG domain
MSEVDRDEAWRLFCEWTESESLRKHVLGVEACMVAYAPDYDGDEELWAATGILHDLDYEKHPDMDANDGHPRTALKVLREKGYPDELIDAVAGHAEFLNHPRTTPLAKTLFAVDELSGFVAACALVRPTGIVGLTPKSVKKKLKQPSFAAAVDREQMRRAADELGVDFDEHLQRVIDAMEPRAEELGLTGQQEPSDHPA